VKSTEGSQLTNTEKKGLFSKCEAAIRANVEGFFAVGLALTTIRSNHLYKLDGFKKFEAYCEARWSFGKARASQLIKAAKTVNNCKLADLPSPANEGQARELAKLKPEQQIEVWKAVIKKAPADKITAQVVAKAVTSKLTPKQSKAAEAEPTPEPESDGESDEVAQGDEGLDATGEEAAGEDDDEPVVIFDGGAISDDPGETEPVAEEAAEPPLTRMMVAIEDEPLDAYHLLLKEMPGVLGRIEEHLDEVVGNAMDSEDAVAALRRIADSVEVLIQAETDKAAALAGAPA
jgi:hypothetical protein